MARSRKEPWSTPGETGLALVFVAAQWRREFRSEMVKRGFGWHAGAGSDLLAQLGPEGTSQAALSERLGITKQAVQQLLDRLVESGVVRREADPGDARARRIMRTEIGHADFVASRVVRTLLEERCRKRLGDRLFKRFRKALRVLAQD